MTIKQPKTLRVGIYLRLSNEDKDKLNKDEPSESIKNQRNMLIDYINKHRDLCLVDEYCDEDLSGAGTYRPEFERLIADCEKHKLDVVLCKSQSRFSRDMEIVEKYIHNKFKEWHIRFIGLADNADTDNYGNKKARQINGLVNEWYLEDVSNNIRSAFNSKMQAGEFISPFAAFGYEIAKNDNNKLVIDPLAAEVVKKIFHLYLTGLGFTGIAKYLNQQNIPSPSLYKLQHGKKLNVVSQKPREEIKWSANAIKTILTNELYLGHLVQGKRTTISYKNHKIIKKNEEEWIKRENTHEAIIDKSTFASVQKMRKERTKPIKTTKAIHIFSGKVFCLECGNLMRKKNSQKHEYLVCSKNHDEYKACPNAKSIRYDILEEIILETINNRIKDFFDIEELEKINKEKNKLKLDKTVILLEEQKLIIKKQIRQNQNYLKSLYEDKVNKVIDTQQFKQLVKEYTKKEELYNRQLVNIKQNITQYKSNEKHRLNNSFSFNKYQRLTMLNPLIINEFIDKIYIGKINEEKNSRDIQIKWNLEKL